MRRGFSLVELLISMIILAIAISSILPLVATYHKITKKTFAINQNSTGKTSGNSTYKPSSSVNDAVLRASTVLENLSKFHSNSTCLEGNYTCASSKKGACCGVYAGDPSISVSVTSYNGSSNLKLITVNVEFSEGNYTMKEIVGIWK